MLIYTPKEAHSRIFMTGGSVFARQMLAKKSFSLARRACSHDQLCVYTAKEGPDFRDRAGGHFIARHKVEGSCILPTKYIGS